MPPLEIDALTQLAFSVSENKGVFALLLGSGLSSAAGIPTGWEITLDLIRRLASAQGVKDAPDWAKWYAEKEGKEPDYSTLLQALAALPAERRAILHSYIEPDEKDREAGGKLPTGAHYAIADLVRSGHVRVIVTTNFDRLMESALRERGVEPTVVSSVDALQGAEPLTHSTCYLLKLHGDYKDARILNTDKELRTYPRPFNKLLDRLFDEHGLVICGWSGEWDEALRRAMLRTPNRRYPIYWAARGALRDNAKELAAQRKARLVSIADANSFFSDLRDRVHTLEQARRVNPRNVDLIVETAKRFIGKAEYRVQLDDLIAREADSLSHQTNDGTIIGRPQPQVNVKEFTPRAKRLEAETEVLARICGTLGRWDADNSAQVVADLVRMLYAGSRVNIDGFTAWSDLRAYPAVLLATAFGLGAVRSMKWHALFKFLSVQIAKDDKTLWLAECVGPVAPGAYTGGRDWGRFEGLEKTPAPFNQHLHDLFASWSRSFAIIPSDFTLVFERFELLTALAVMGRQIDLSTLQKSKTDSSHQLYTPSGLYARRWPDFNLLVQEMQTGAMRDTLLNAGFANGSPDYLSLFIEASAQTAGRMRF